MDFHFVFFMFSNVKFLAKSFSRKKVLSEKKPPPRKATSRKKRLVTRKTTSLKEPKKILGYKYK